MRDDANNLSEAVSALKTGKAVIFPTDTVYGLGVAVAYADSPQAIYDLKERDAGKPVAWLVGGLEALGKYGADVPEEACELARKHWPGALTIIVKASDDVPEAYRSGRGTIGLRMPASEVALALIDAVGCPLATSSANMSGGADPGTAEEIPLELSEKAGAVVLGIEKMGGTPSTVIDCSQGKIEVLREGGIHV